MRIQLFLIYTLLIFAGAITLSSSNKMVNVEIEIEDGIATYSVKYGAGEMLLPSRLGIKTNIGDFTKGLTLKDIKNGTYSRTDKMTRTKTSRLEFFAKKYDIYLQNEENNEIIVTFLLSDNNVAFRYTLLRQEDDNPKCALVYSEASSFLFPEGTTTFISPQSDPMIGFERSKPSYEEVYSADAEMNVKSQYGHGYVFPALFHRGNHGWVLLGETGVTSGYVGSHLSDFSPETGYTIEYPMEGENNGYGSTFASISVPGNTPWRTITVGASLAPIVLTSIQYVLVDPLYKPSIDYKPGRYTWSWLIWQDDSINYEDQIEFIDLAATMGYEYCLVDAGWDVNIGYNKMEELSKYAQSKGVRLLLWYNSNGHANDAPQTPKDKMDTSIAREKEMKWLKSIGVAGIKVDFFGGDKQVTMKLYEDILSDANRYELQVIFHGCTLPRGWERLYPNFVASEAVLASENVFFNEESAIRQPFDLTLHPFCRNAFASMDWGGVIMNRYMSRDNKSRHTRKTTDVFEMASGIIMQTSVQCVAIQPNNLDELPEVEINFLKELPTYWNSTSFLDGYPGKYVVLGRRHENKWYYAGINAEKEVKELNIKLSQIEPGTTVNYYTDDENGYAILTKMEIDETQRVKVIMQPNGGFIIS